MAYTYDPIFATDPNNAENVASNASIIIFDPADSGMAPITITDVTGAALPNPITVSKNGFGPAFVASIERVGWHGGGFTGYFTSYEGIKAAAVAAQVAAENAGASAGAAATASLAEAVADADSAAAAAVASAAAAATSAALVGAPADSAVQTLINAPASATRGALNATYATPASVAAKALDGGYADSQQSLAEIMKPVRSKVASSKPGNRAKIKILGWGPSIMTGGAVTNYDTDGPLPLFVAALKKYLDPMDMCDFEGYNLGIDGSVVNQWLTPINAWLAGVTVKMTGLPTGGTFTLTYGGNTTSALAYNATAATIQAALEALASIGAGNVKVYDQQSRAFRAFTVALDGTLVASNPAALTASAAGLTGGTSPAIAVTVNGTADVALGIPGMNDFTGAQWHRNQTFDGAFGFMTKLRGLLDRLNEISAVSIVATTPHMHPGRLTSNGGLPPAEQAAGQGITYPATDVYKWPGWPNPADEMPVITLPNGNTVKTLSRFLQGNDGIRAVCAEKGAVCLNADLLFLNRAAVEGYDALYPVGSTFNHPTTYGIAVSYGEAFTSAFRSLVNARTQVTALPAGVGGDLYPVGYKAHKIRPDNAAANTSTTPVADTQLKYTFPLIAAATKWRVRGVVHYSVPTAQDARLSWTTTGLTLANSRWAVHAPGSGAAFASVTGAAPGVNSIDGTFRSAAMSTAMLIGGNGADAAAFIDATVDVPAGGGQLLTLNSYLDVTGGTLTVYAMSNLTFERIS